MGTAERSNLYRPYVYLKMFVKGFLRHPGAGFVYSSLKYYRSWKEHLKADRNSVDDRLPWISFYAIGFLERIVRPDMRVFEYGSGGSTLFWADRVKEVVSVEHDRRWFNKLQEAIRRERIGNVRYILAEPEPDADNGGKDISDPAAYVSDDPHYAGMNFERYVRTIDEYPEGYFDIVVVDGRARPSCIAHAKAKVKPGGRLIIDNTERPYYQSAVRAAGQQWKTRIFGGPVPYIYHFSDTTILQKMDKSQEKVKK